MECNIFSEISRQRTKFIKCYDSILRNLIIMLYNNGVPCSRKELLSDLVVKTCFHERKMYRKLDLLRKVFKVTAAVNYKALDLVRVFYFLDRNIAFNELPLKNWVYVYGQIISPKGTLVAYYFPKSTVNEDFIYDLLRELSTASSGSNIFIAYDTIFPNLVVTDNNFFFQLDKSSIERILCDKFNNDVNIRYDYIDLLIVKELEKNPLIKFDELARNINIGKGKVIKHFREHVCRYQLIKKIIPEFIVDKNDYFIDLLVVIRKYGRQPIPSIFTKLNSFFSIHLGLDAASFIFSTRLSLSGLLAFAHKINSISTNGGISLHYSTYIVNPLTIKKFTIPYEKYSRTMKTWEKPSL